MVTLIIGGSGSGKSAYAEECIGTLSAGSTKYYLATMQAFGKEGQAKVERHRKLRSGKGFITIEQPVAIHEALEIMGEKETKVLFEKGEVARSRTALLECMSNLVANEMFSCETPISAEAVTEKVMKEITLLSKGIKHLVIVSNNVFEDGVVYDETTMEYLQALGRINEKLAEMADQVVEVVVGIPLVLKEKK